LSLDGKYSCRWTVESIFEQDYGSFASRADLFRRIGLDEREHKEESLQRCSKPRFS